MLLLLFASFWVFRGHQPPPWGKGGKEKKPQKKTTTILSVLQLLANTGIVKHRVQHFALKGWIRSEIIAIVTAIRPFLFPRVPWVMEKHFQ